MGYNTLMQGYRKIFRNPWAILGGVFAVAILFGLGLFAVQTVSYIGDIRAGEPSPFQVTEYSQKAALILSQSPVSREIRARIVSDGNHPMLGNPDAPIQIVEFLDYECPYCRRTAPELRSFMARHPDDVLLITRDFPLESVHVNAMDAAISSRCVFQNEGADTYWLYHDLLFRNQEDLSRASLRAFAESLRVDLGAYDACVKNREPEARIKTSLQDGVAAGVKGTPTFFVNGYPVPGVVDLPTLEALREALLADL